MSSLGPRRGWTTPCLPRPNNYYSTLLEFFSKVFKRVDATLGLLCDSQFSQSDNAAVDLSFANSQLTKLLVQDYENTTFYISYSQNLAISWIVVPVTGPFGIIPGINQFFVHRLRHTRVNEELHAVLARRFAGRPS